MQRLSNVVNGKNLQNNSVGSIINRLSLRKVGICLQIQLDMKTHYDSYINRQKKGYETTAKIIGYVIEKMQESRLISGNVQITGRIKSYQSAYENSKRKCVDDCFGVRIIAPESDLKRIRKELEQILVIKKTKYHIASEEKNYSAIHQMAYIKKRYIGRSDIDYELFPIVEIQYWDMHTADLCVSGELSYANYKKEDFKKILGEYLNNPQDALDELPIYYDIYGEDIRQLAPEETLFRLYPEIRQIEEQRKSEPDTDEIEI